MGERVSKVIAIIDDEPEMEGIYSMMLAPFIDKKLLKLNFFSDSKQFLRWFQSEKIDLILSDINMPGISGIELCQIIKSQGCRTPIYLISGYEPTEYKSIMHECGIKKFLSKPFDFQKLQVLIESELGLTPLYT